LPGAGGGLRPHSPPPPPSPECTPEEI